jgi:fatty acid desaturase
MAAAEAAAWPLRFVAQPCAFHDDCVARSTNAARDTGSGSRDAGDVSHAATSGAGAHMEPEELAALQKRSSARGLVRLALHLAAIALTGAAYGAALQRPSGLLLVAMAAIAHGFTLVTMFAAMHECVHRTAFASRTLNDGVAWFAGLLSFYNSTFYRPYHAWHHRFTQLPGKDPELDDHKPESIGGYLLELSALTWWLGKLKTYAALASGRTAAYPFLSEQTTPVVVRSVRLQLAAYALLGAVSLAVGEPYFVWFWLLPVAVAQPLLRAILLAEHTGCSQDGDPVTNTRTTLTAWPVRLLMWEMPYHAEHHRYPALPFFALARVHARLGPQFAHVERHGYTGFHARLLRSLARRSAQQGAE